MTASTYEVYQNLIVFVLHRIASVHLLLCAIRHQIMIEIESSNFNSHHLEQLHTWFVEEWEEVDPFVDCKNGVALPAPILALDSGVLIGGLSFTGYNKPNSSSVGVWVNALFVLPEKRGTGVASKLLQTAEKEAQKLGVKELYARSDVPALYEKLNWQVLYQTSEGTRLKRNLST